jgi:hypothetical protein
MCQLPATVPKHTTPQARNAQPRYVFSIPAVAHRQQDKASSSTIHAGSAAKNRDEGVSDACGDHNQFGGG